MSVWWRKASGILILWLCVIFVTSCFVVPFDTFIHAIQNLSSSQDFRQWFDQFWVGDWFFVVKGWHMTEYAILASLAIAALRRSCLGSSLRSVGLAFGLAVLFAASDEWHQTFVPGRDGNVRDVFIDAGGAFLASLCWTALFWRERRKGLKENDEPLTTDAPIRADVARWLSAFEAEFRARKAELSKRKEGRRR